MALICAALPTLNVGVRAEGAVDPLTITIDAMTTTTSNGDIRLSGYITNTDDQAWRDINILPCLSTTPIGTIADFRTATETPGDAFVCKRDPRAFTILKRLDPGMTLPWTLTVPRALLPHAYAGVYWFGVHALGTNDAGVSKNADGRARTFLPVVGPTTHQARVHLTYEFTEAIEYDRAGHLLETTSYAPGAPTWASEFRDHLGRLLVAVNSTPGADLLVDPAVIDAASRLADGNAGWLGEPGLLADTKAAAQAWLRSFKYVAQAHQVWVLPYGDVDVAATADRKDIAAAAENLAVAPLRAIGVHATPARRAPDFSASAAVLAGPAGSTAFVDARVAGPQARAHGVQVVGTALASLGAPKPGDPYAAVRLRQQILSEAALHVGSTSPVVVVIPSNFAPADPVGFATGLKAPWVSLESLPQALHGLTPRTFPEQPNAGPETPLVRLSVAAYDSATRTAATLHTITGLDVAGPVTRSALAGLSPRMISGFAAQDVGARVGDLLGSVKVTAPPGVTLSGSSGRFSLGVENNLPVPVTVSLRASSDPDTSIGHFGTMTLAPHASGNPLANVSINTHGNHRVQFLVTDPAGHPTGAMVEVTVRSVQVSGVIWAFIAGGVGLLGLAIAMRLVRRIRSRR